MIADISDPSPRLPPVAGGQPVLDVRPVHPYDHVAAAVQEQPFQAVDRLDSLVDLDAYPIHRLDSPVRAELVAETRSQMDAVGCFRISNFMRPEAVAAMLAEANEFSQHLTALSFRVEI